jgi:membrane protein YqaA with SNARE-associated domain
MTVYLTLCFSAFVSATIFPMGSEALLIYDLEQGFDPFLLIFFASLGNILGSGVNYWFGLKGEEYLENKKVIKPHQMEKSKKFFSKYGGYSLLLAWVPMIGDTFTFAAGILRYDIKKFFLFVSIGKVGRYLFLYWGWTAL